MIKISHSTTITSQCSFCYFQQLNPSKGCMGPISRIHSPSDRKPKALIKLNQVHFQVIKMIKLKHRNSNSFSKDNEIKQDPGQDPEALL